VAEIMRRSVILLLFLFCLSLTYGQKRKPEWYELIHQPGINFYEVKSSFQKYEKLHSRMQKEERREKEEGREGEEGEKELPGFEIYKRWEYFMEPRVFPSGDLSLPMRTGSEYNKFQNNLSLMRTGSSGTNSFASISNWSPVGPATVPTNGGGVGRINCVRIDPVNTSIIYVCSPSGGLWKSVNGGTSWATSTDYLSVVGATDLVIDPVNTSVLFLATGDGDHGDTHSAGVMKSTDGGATWTTTGLIFSVSSATTIHRLLMDPTNNNILYAATTFGIFKTINAGVSWTNIISGNFSDMELKPSTPTTIYAVTSNTFYLSVNSGGTWTASSTGLPTTSSVNRLAIGVSAASPSTVYVLASNSSGSNYKGIYKSTDSGVTFGVQSTTPNILGYDTGGDTGGQGWYDLSIAVSPTNASDVTVGGVNHWRSTNDGKNWTQKSHWYGGFGFPYVHADVHALEFLPGSSTTLFSGNDGGIFKTTNNGTTWTDLSSNLPIKQYYKIAWSPTTTTKVMGGSQDNGTDQYNGASWTRVLSGDGMDCMYDFTNSNTLYGEVYYGDIYKSINGGSSWTEIVASGGSGVNEDGNWVTPMAMSPASASTIYVGKTQVYKSINGGSSWAVVGSITGTNKVVALALTAANSNYIYAVKSNLFFVSTNGTSFTNRTAGLPVSSASITSVTASSTNANEVWVSFSGYASGEKVYYSSDAGVTWTNVSGNLPNLPVNCVSYRPGSNSEIYVGADVGVFVKDVNMSSWQPFNSNLPNVVVTDIEFNNTLNKMRIGTFGRGIWESSIPALNTLVADFYADIVQSCVNSNIVFTNTTYGSVTGYSWNFGSGASPATSTSSGPVTVSYSTPGLKTITLTVNGPGGTNMMTKTNYVSIYSPPSAPGIITGPSALCGNSLNSKVYSIAPVSGATNYLWTVPTGATITSGQGTASITVNFSSIGGIVSVTPYNNSCQSSTQKVTVTINQLPTVNAGPDQSICTGSSTTLTATSPSQSATSPIRITEITHFIGGTGGPSSFPAFLEESTSGSDDYIELSNLCNGSINAGGIIVQRWTGTTINQSYTIPLNTILPSGQPLVIHYGAGVDDVTNFYFRAGGSANAMSSGTAAGYVLLSGATIIDAVGVNGYSFPAASGVLAGNWSGSIATMTNLAGCMLISADNNTASAWQISSSTTPFTSFGFLNPGLAANLTEPVSVSWSTVPASAFTANGFSVSSGTLNSNTTFRALLANSMNSCTAADSISVTVNGSPADVSIVANPSGTFCQGTNVVFTATPINGGAPAYQWKKNGTNVGINSASYSDNTLFNGDQISCVMTSTATCATNNPATSNILNESVIGLPTITSFNPTSGIIGNSVVINGTNFITVNSVKFNNTSATFVVNSSTQITATVPAGATSGNINVTTNCSSVSGPSPFTIVTPVISLNLHVLIEGFYRGGGTMTAIVNPGVCDTISVELHQSVSPYTLLATSKSTINTTGNGTFTFSSSLIGGNYYLVVHHRNTLETWSRLPLSINTSAVSYDFTTSDIQAFGNNLKNLNDGRFAIFSGDVNQNNTIDQSDLDAVELAEITFLAGYRKEELTGDVIVESADYSVTENNLFVHLMRP
jgi:hypothetical protein